jgi:hypothetical protein
MFYRFISVALRAWGRVEIVAVTLKLKANASTTTGTD